ncbi:hypothetical protein PA598K_00799 [Paenibacillus sp. 598K]|uniref:ribosomal maturation YjgA family protein n=1 Tax=Paenibacillus sp. 598K TaxID=1117987 RepID=UPI000FF9C03A|nr:DUF2809 domain-containing protein [Paenibacillus sp. 598K]GBF72543.1 hypothetical protein PA598K_00799 [Paenibacillus sp. 598K]
MLQMRNHSLRRRLLYLLVIIVVILLGLGSRRYAEHLPPFVGVHVGDALWAAMIYFGFRFLRPQSGLRHAAALSLLFCFAIELSQLYQAEWINDIRSTTLGGLILGRGFLVVDLVRYTAGIACVALLDWCVRLRR